MPSKLRASDLKNGNYQNRKNFIYVDGDLIHRQFDKEKYNVVTMLSKLENGEIKTLGRPPIEEKSENFLQDLGITIEPETKIFSLKKISKDREVIKNPNILETKDYSQINNEYDKPDDKFPNEDDPFYQLDDYRDQKDITKNKRKNPQAITLVASRLASLNLNGKKLKNFQFLETSK